MKNLDEPTLPTFHWPLPFWVGGGFLFPLTLFVEWYTQHIPPIQFPEFPPIRLHYPDFLFSLDISLILAGFFCFFLFFSRFWKLCKKLPSVPVFPIRGIDLLGLFFCLLLLQIISFRGASYLISQEEWELYPTLYFFNSGMLAFLVLLILGMVPFSWNISWTQFGFRSGTFILWAPWVVYFGFYPFLVTSELLINPQQEIAQPLARYFITGQATLGMKLQTVFLVPFVEEVLFRGVILPWLIFLSARWFKQEQHSILFGLVGSSFLFALVHGESLLMIQIFILGLALGFLRIAFQSLYPCILFHMIHNGLTCIKFDLLAPYFSS